MFNLLSLLGDLIMRCDVLMLGCLGFTLLFGCQAFEDANQYPFGGDQTDVLISSSGDASTDVDSIGGDVITGDASPSDVTPLCPELPTEIVGAFELACVEGCCPGNMKCLDGVCGCPAGVGDCDGSPLNGCEVSLLGDASNCGRCENICPFPEQDVSNRSCSDGVCNIICGAGFGDCDGDITNGCETLLLDNPSHCGECDKTCGEGMACAGELCECRDANLSTNSNCGGCGVQCTEGQECQNINGGWACDCLAPLIKCNGGCVDPGASNDHCGGCDIKCPDKASCNDGLCFCLSDPSISDSWNTSALCGAGEFCCGGACVANDCRTACGPVADCGANGNCCGGFCVPSNSWEHCLGCDESCGVGMTCETSGVCLCQGEQCFPSQICGDVGCECPPSKILCGDECVDIYTNPSSCGGCGEAFDCNKEIWHTDPSATLCLDGECFIECADGWGDCHDDPPGCETNLLEGDIEATGQTLNCGMCGRTCGINRECVDGACLCDGNLTDCSSAGISSASCVDLESDRNSCGDCGVTCRADQVCLGGSCVCPPELDIVSCGGTSGADRCCVDCIGGNCVLPTGVNGTP